MDSKAPVLLCIGRNRVLAMPNLMDAFLSGRGTCFLTDAQAQALVAQIQNPSPDFDPESLPPRYQDWKAFKVDPRVDSSLRDIGSETEVLTQSLIHPKSAEFIRAYKAKNRQYPSRSIFQRSMAKQYHLTGMREELVNLLVEPRTADPNPIPNRARSKRKHQFLAAKSPVLDQSHAKPASPPAAPVDRNAVLFQVWSAKKQRLDQSAQLDMAYHTESAARRKTRESDIEIINSYEAQLVQGVGFEDPSSAAAALPVSAPTAQSSATSQAFSYGTANAKNTVASSSVGTGSAAGCLTEQGVLFGGVGFSQGQDPAPTFSNDAKPSRVSKSSNKPAL